MHKDVCIVKLPGEKNYAVISPGRVAYGLNATELELNQLVAEEESKLEQAVLDKVYEFVPSTSLGIIPTFDCNLNCIYCYARGGETKEIIPLETCKAAIRDATSSNNRELLRIYLVGGGEPLLYLDSVEYLVNYAKTIYQNVEVNVVTNGTFDNKVFGWLLANNVSIRVSYDGVMQDIQRPFANGTPSSKIVENNIRKLIENDAFVITQCIVTRMGTHTMCETIEKVHSLGVNAIKFEPALATDISRADKNIEPDPKEYAEALLEAIRYIAEQDYDMTVDTGYFAEPSTEYYCGMALSNRIITPHGKITSCVEVARPEDPYASTVMIGQIEHGRMVVSEAKRDGLLAMHYKYQIGGCSDCDLRLICHGGCPMSNIWKGGLPIRKSLFTCVVEKTILPKLLMLLAEDPQIASVVMENGHIEYL
jgi:uncharacterized protein